MDTGNATGQSRKSSVYYPDYLPIKIRKHTVIYIQYEHPEKGQPAKVALFYFSHGKSSLSQNTRTTSIYLQMNKGPDSMTIPQ